MRQRCSLVTIMIYVYREKKVEEMNGYSKQLNGTRNGKLHAH